MCSVGRLKQVRCSDRNINTLHHLGSLRHSTLWLRSFQQVDGIQFRRLRRPLAIRISHSLKRECTGSHFRVICHGRHETRLFSYTKEMVALPSSVVVCSY
jgi:hypothetical protein